MKIDISELGDEKKLFELMVEYRASDISSRMKRIQVFKEFFRRYSADISPSADFSDIPTFPHGYHGFFISSGAKIGKSCVIFQQVTIGSNLSVGSPGVGFPIIGIIVILVLELKL